MFGVVLTNRELSDGFAMLAGLLAHVILVVTLGFSPRPLLLAISANPVNFKVFKCLTKLKRSLCSSPLSGILNFYWVAVYGNPSWKMGRISPFYFFPCW